ncbi:Neutrophil cytosol factor 2 [Liparis tanakae]|uniref:Neutrophil cytosol factor 2 n=1 Tax=Liparis tanakae TaxID=230148 RepID=A0A4Z2HGX7_9TELE|nr:Neutrophil cytosol factor 2 [Liparis tanakae]
MSFVDTLRQWDQAVTCVDKQDLTEALRIFLSIQEPNSKIYFDIGCLHLLNEDLDAAEKVLLNMALSEAQLENWDKAHENLVKALNYKTDAKLNIIDRALDSALKQKLFKPVEFPSKVLFKPNKHYVAELEKKDYLGKAKVVASVVPQDAFSGFAPLQPQVKDGPTSPKEPEVLRALEGEPHTVRFAFVPETSDELAVVPGNIVFVLQKGADNWASVIFNERVRPLGQNLDRGNLSLRVENPPSDLRGYKDEQPTDNLCIVKVRFTFNFAFSVPLGSPSELLIDKISNKLNLPSTATTLSLTPEATEQSVITPSTDMESVWRGASGLRITLWCHANEQTDGTPQSEVHLVALHSYESSNPEDLNFHQGDTITLLTKINQDWLEGQCSGTTGIFPASFVEEVPVDGRSLE